MKIRLLIATAAWLLASPMGAQAAPVNAAAYGSLSGTQLITFEDVAGGLAPGMNHDGIFVAGGVRFGERFVGQANTPSGGFDVLSGVPGAPLALAAGLAGQNLNIYSYLTVHSALTGLGPLGYPDFDAIGEGSIAMLFTSDQSEFGFQLLGGGGGSATVDFFRRDGSLVERIVLLGLGDGYYGFRRDNQVKDIAGVSIFNSDPSGIGFDNLRHDVASDGTGRTASEPGTLALAGLCLAGLAALRRRQPSRPPEALGK